VNRALFAITLALILLAAPLAAETQPMGKVPHIALVLGAAPVAEMLGPDPVHPHVRAFLHGLRDLGYVEGRNILIERRSAEGRLDRLPGIFAELVRGKVDVIVTATIPVAEAAKQATSTIPIVMAVAGEPVAAGLVASLPRPGGNVTGLTQFVDLQLEGKLLELLKETVPRASHVAVLYATPWLFGRPVTIAFKQLFAAADAFGITLLPVGVDSQEQYTQAFATIARQRADALVVQAHGFNYARRSLIVDLVTGTGYRRSFLFATP
jgi:ABC-type uncharacterized transport system substrate-binding protein